VAHVEHSGEDENVSGRQHERVLVVSVDHCHRPVFPANFFLKFNQEAF
jgi:hypothetical protein